MKIDVEAVLKAENISALTYWDIAFFHFNFRISIIVTFLGYLDVYLLNLLPKRILKLFCFYNK